MLTQYTNRYVVSPYTILELHSESNDLGQIFWVPALPAQILLRSRPTVCVEWLGGASLIGRVIELSSYRVIESLRLSTLVRRVSSSAFILHTTLYIPEFNRQLLSVDNFVYQHGFGRYSPLCSHCCHPLLYPPGFTSRGLFSDPFYK